jgi:hypothetical protein
MQYSHDRHSQSDVPGIDSQIREIHAKTGKNGKDWRKKVSNIRSKGELASHATASHITG